MNTEIGMVLLIPDRGVAHYRPPSARSTARRGITCPVRVVGVICPGCLLNPDKEGADAENMLHLWNAAASRLPWKRSVGFLSRSTRPIAIDFGCASVKLLQLSSGAQPHVVAGAEFPVPEEARESTESLLEFHADELQTLLQCGAFKGRRVICTLPSSQTIVQHLQITRMDGVTQEDLVKSQLGMQMNVPPGSIVVRTFDVREMQRDGQNRKEVICFTMPREVVMRYVSMLEQCKLTVESVHTSTMAMIRAFDHLHKQSADGESTTMYIDLGYSGTRVAITHGTNLVFARTIQAGGQHLDQLIARQRGTTITEAHEYRLEMNQSWSATNGSKKASDSGPTPAEAPVPQPEPVGEGEMGNEFARLSAAMAKERAAASPSAPDTHTDTPGRQTEPDASPAAVAHNGRQEVGGAPASHHANAGEDEAPSATQPDLSELLETITDELSMCVRYHQGLFPKQPIQRVVVVGGESRQGWLCQHVVRSLRLPARLGDPMARFLNEETMNNVGLFQPGKPNPDWAMACGLCSLQTHE